MSMFPGKTQIELHAYFMALDYQQLTTINHQFGSHFIKLEARLEHINTQINNRNARLQKNRVEMNVLNTQIPFLNDRDREYSRNLENLMESSSRSERYLGLQNIRGLPSDIHRTDTALLTSESVQLSRTIVDLEGQVQHITSLKSRAVQELKLLERIRDLKRPNDIPDQVHASYSFK